MKPISLLFAPSSMSFEWIKIGDFVKEMPRNFVVCMFVRLWDICVWSFTLRIMRDDEHPVSEIVRCRRFFFLCKKIHMILSCNRLFRPL